MNREILLEKWSDDKYLKKFNLLEIDTILKKYTDFCEDGGRRNITVSIEEVSELMQVITKDIRLNPDRFNYIEELADCTICSIYIVYVCNLSYENIVRLPDTKIDSLYDCLRLLNDIQGNLIQWIQSSCCRRFLEDSVKQLTDVVAYLMNLQKISKDEINKMMCIKVDKVKTVYDAHKVF